MSVSAAIMLQRVFRTSETALFRLQPESLGDSSARIRSASIHPVILVCSLSRDSNSSLLAGQVAAAKLQDLALVFEEQVAARTGSSNELGGVRDRSFDFF